MFREIIPFVVFSGFPINLELPLSYTVADPIKSHVNCFGSFLFHCVVDYALGTGIVCLDGGCWLWVAQENEALSEGASVLCVVKKSAYLRFGGGCHDVVHDGAVYVDGSIEGCWWGIRR